MLDSLEVKVLLRSGLLVIDRAKHEVHLDGRPLSISGLPFRILEELVAAEARVVSRAELKRKLWPHAIRIDTERRLNTAVRALREALGDMASEPSLIRTVRGHGYKWIGGEQRPRHISARWQIAAVAAIALLAAAPAALVSSQRISARPDDLGGQRRLAWMYVNQGRPDAALPHLVALVQAGTPDTAELGWLLLRSGRPEAALIECSVRVPDSINLLSCRQTAFARLGLIAEARATAVEIMNLAGADSGTITDVARAPAPIGYARFLKWRVNAFVRSDRDWFQRAQLQADAGMYPEALASLRQAARVRDPLLVRIGSSLEFAPLRHSAEFRRIAAAVTHVS